jgi:hypothetical protein
MELLSDEFFVFRGWEIGGLEFDTFFIGCVLVEEDSQVCVLSLPKLRKRKKKKKQETKEK